MTRLTEAGDHEFVDARFDKRLLHAALYFLLAFNIAGLVVYNFFTYRLEFHSDAAVKNLFAEEVLRQRSLFPADWAYVHGEMFVFFGHLPIIPLLFVSENGFALHAISATIFGGLLLLTVWWLAGVLELSRTARLLGLCLVASGVSPIMAEAVYGQAAYGPATILLLVQLGLLIRLHQHAQRDDPSSYRRSLLWLCVASSICFLSSPVRALMTFTFPLAIAAVCLVTAQATGSGWVEAVRRRVLRHRWALVLYLAACAIGAAAHAHFLNRAISVAESAKRTLVSAGELTDKVGLLGQSLLAVAGATPLSRAGIASLAGIFLLTHLLLFAVVFYSSIKLSRLAAAPAERDAAGASVANAFLYSFVIVAFLYTFTDLSVNIATSRYFAPSFTLGLVSMLTWIDRQSRREVNLGFLVVACTALLVAALSFRLFLWPLFVYYKERNWELALPASEFDGLIRFLEQNNLQYGYASYWNANVTTVLSGGRVTIRPVTFRGPSEPVPSPMLHLSSAHWYAPPPNVAETFLLFDPNESKAFDLRRLERIAGPALRTLNYAGYTIYVFKGNLGERLSGWGLTLAHQSTLRYNETTLHQIGRPADSNGGLVATSGEAGYLVYGPYWDLMPGKYLAEFAVSNCATGPAVLGEADVSGYIGGKLAVVVSAPIPADTKNQALSLPFEFRVPTTGVEFRIRSNGSGCLRADQVVVRRTDIAESAPRDAQATPASK